MTSSQASPAGARWLFWGWMLYAAGSLLFLNWQAMVRYGVQLCGLNNGT